MMGRNTEIMANLSRAVAADANDVIALKLLAVHRTCWGYVWGREGRRTLHLAQRAIRLAPDVSEGWEALAEYHAARGEGEVGIALWNAYLVRIPDDARALRLCAGHLIAVRSADEAAEFMRRAARLAPDDFLVNATLCYALASAGLAAEAEPHVERLLGRFGDRWECHTRAGFVLAAWLGQPKRGCDVSRRATELQPGLDGAWRLHADTLWAAGRGEEAHGALGKAWELRARPRWPLLTMQAVDQCRHRGDAVREREWLERALGDARDWFEMSPSQSHFYCGQALEGLGDAVGAITAYRAALEIGLLQFAQMDAARAALRRLAPSPPAQDRT
jgi:tetratricopeptide (TPR) repeat protein